MNTSFPYTKYKQKKEKKRRSTFTVYLVCMNTDTGHLMYTTKSIGIVTNRNVRSRRKETFFQKILAEFQFRAAKCFRAHIAVQDKTLTCTRGNALAARRRPVPRRLNSCYSIKALFFFFFFY